jgi:hypothetical protein
MLSSKHASSGEMEVNIASSMSSGSVPSKTDDNDIDTSSIIIVKRE